MKTLFIYDDCASNLKFFTKDSDSGYKHLDRIYANSCVEEGNEEAAEAHDQKIEEVLELLGHDTEDGEYEATKMSTTFPPKDQYDEVVIIGFLP